MSAVKDYALTLVGACLACGGITMLTPAGHFEKVMRLLAGVFILFCIISPIKDGLDGLFSYDLSYSFGSGDYTDATPWEYSSRAMEEAVENKIYECVKTLTGDEAVSVSVEIDTDGSAFTLTGATVVIPAEHAGRAAAVADYIRMETGVQPQVITE